MPTAPEATATRGRSSMPASPDPTHVLASLVGSPVVLPSSKLGAPFLSFSSPVPLPHGNTAEPGNHFIISLLYLLLELQPIPFLLYRSK